MVNNEELLTKVLQMLSQFLTGANAFNVPNTAFTPGFSYAHNVGQYQQDLAKRSFTSPITADIYNHAGRKLYENSLRLLGYSPTEATGMANKQDGGPGFIKWAASTGMEMYMANSASHFANAAYQRMLYATPTANIANTRKDYQDAGKAIFEGISDSTIRGYTVPEALDVTSMFIRQGRYDNVQGTQRIEQIKKDLQDYAKGISNLKDGLQGSLEQVLTSFEKLTGSSATVTQKDRFTSLTRSIYNATVFGGVTPQLLSSSVATQNAYLQGLGATQATAAAIGIVNANVLAQGASIEGATTDTMGEGLNRLGAQWVSTGRMKELTAAYSWWTDKTGRSRNAETFQAFVEGQLNGNLDAANVQNYLTQQGVTGEYINSARIRRNMAAPYMHTAFLKERVDQYTQRFNSFMQENIGYINSDDMLKTDDELFDQLVERIKQHGVDNTSAVNEATRLVEQRRRMYGDIMYMTDADTGFNLLRNIGITERQQRRQKSTDILANLLGGKTSLTGFTGVLNSFLKEQKLDEFTFADVLKAGLGIDIDSQTIKSLMDEKISAEEKTKLLRAAGVQDVDIEFASKQLTKLSGAERKALFDVSNDQRKLSDGTTYGDLRKSIANSVKLIRTDKGLTASGKTKFRDDLDKAVKEGFLSKEEAFIISQSGTTDFGTNPNALETLQRTYNAVTYATDKLNLSKDEAYEFGNNFGKLKTLDPKTNKEAYDKVHKEVLSKIIEKDKDVQSLTRKKGETDAEYQKRQTELATSKLNSMTNSPTDLVGFLAEILNELKKLVVK